MAISLSTIHLIILVDPFQEMEMVHKDSLVKSKSKSSGPPRLRDSLCSFDLSQGHHMTGRSDNLSGLPGMILFFRMYQDYIKVPLRMEFPFKNTNTIARRKGLNAEFFHWGIARGISAAILLRVLT